MLKKNEIIIRNKRNVLNFFFCKFQLCYRGKIQSHVEGNFQSCQLWIRRFFPPSPYSSLENPLCTAIHFIIQLNRTLFEILPNKSRRNDFEICRSKQIRCLFPLSSCCLSLPLSLSPRDRHLFSCLYFILLNGRNAKDQSRKIYVSARKHKVSIC